MANRPAATPEQRERLKQEIEQGGLWHYGEERPSLQTAPSHATRNLVVAIVSGVGFASLLIAGLTAHTEKSPEREIKFDNMCQAKGGPQIRAFLGVPCKSQQAPSVK